MAVINIDMVHPYFLHLPIQRYGIGRAVPVFRGPKHGLARGLGLVRARRRPVENPLRKPFPRSRVVERPHQHRAVAAADQRDVAPDPAVVVEGELEPGPQRARHAA